MGAFALLLPNREICTRKNCCHPDNPQTINQSIRRPAREPTPAVKLGSMRQYCVPTCTTKPEQQRLLFAVSAPTTRVWETEDSSRFRKESTAGLQNTLARVKRLGVHSHLHFGQQRPCLVRNPMAMARAAARARHHSVGLLKNSNYKPSAPATERVLRQMRMITDTPMVQVLATMSEKQRGLWHSIATGARTSSQPYLCGNETQMFSTVATSRSCHWHVPVWAPTMASELCRVSALWLVQHVQDMPSTSSRWHTSRSVLIDFVSRLVQLICSRLVVLSVATLRALQPQVVQTSMLALPLVRVLAPA